MQATCTLASGAEAAASVPSGASTGAREARELRDRDATRFGGLGCRQAVAAIEGELSDALTGRSFRTQRALDEALIEVDGTPDKSRLGANAILAVSIAFARAAAIERGLPLYGYLAELIDNTPRAIPRPEVNLFSGGRHAGGQVALQDVLIIPIAARTMEEALAVTFDVYKAAAALVLERYGMRELKADEGGLAPPFPSVEQMLADAAEAISEMPVALSVDVAASQFHQDGTYFLDHEHLRSETMIERILDWILRYPILAVEDGLAETDWRAWVSLRQAAPDTVLIVGDDLLCTNPTLIERAVREGAANALLAKPNQVGTLTEAAEACVMARNATWRVIVSARSGETEDNWLADLAVAWGADLVKIGSIRQSERLSKYNRLLQIERETRLPMAGLERD